MPLLPDPSDPSTWQTVGLDEKPKQPMPVVRAKPAGIDPANPDTWVTAPEPNPLIPAWDLTKGLDPDYTAKVLGIAKKTNLPAPTVDRNMAQIEQDLKLSIDQLDEVFKRAPRASGWLSKNPDNLALAQDDLFNVANLEELLTRNSRGEPDPVNQMTGLEWLWGSAKRAIQAGDAQNQLAYLQMQPQTAEVKEKIDVLKATMPKDPATKDWSDLGLDLRSVKDALEKGWVEAMKMTPQRWEQLKSTSFYGIGGYIVGGVAGGLATGGPGIIPGAKLGGALGSAYGAYSTSQKLEGGGGVTEMDDFRDENGQPLDPALKQMVGEGIGIINGGLEMFQLKTALQAIPGGKKVLSFFTVDAVKEALKSQTVRAALTQVAKLYGSTVLKETAQEVAQEFVTVTGTELAKMVSDGEFAKITPDQFWQRMADTAYSSATAFMVMTAPGSAGQMITETRAARQAQVDSNFFKALDDNVAASKLRERLPEAHAELVEAIRAEGGTPEAVFVEATKLREAAGLEGTTFNQLLTDIGVDPDEFARAEELQADVAIPFKEYASRVAGTALSQKLREDVKFSADGMSQRQAKEFERGYKERVKAAMEEQQANQQQHDAELAQVVGEYKGELKRLGMSDADADASLQPLIKGAGVAAARWTAIKGETVTPAQWLTEVRNLQVRAVDQGQQPARDPWLDTPSGKRYAGMSDSEREGILRQQRSKISELEKDIRPYEDGTYSDLSGEETAWLKEKKDLLDALKRNLAGMETFEKSRSPQENPASALNQDHPAMAGVDMNNAAQVAEAQKLWAEKGVESPYFKKWFGDSKVVDAQGKPLVVYHGTKGDIAAFDGKMTADGGFHFGTAEQANMRVSGEGKRLVPVYLNAGNLQRSKDLGGNWKSKIKAAKAAGKDGIVYLNRYEGLSSEVIQRLSDQGILGKLDRMSDAEFSKAVPEAQDSYIVFDPAQIKSVFNRGTFDANDPRILAQMSPEAKAMGDKIAAALQQGETGPEAGSEVALPPTTLYQVQNLPEWRSNVEAWMKANGYKAKEIKAQLAAMEGQMKIFSALGDYQLELLPQGVNENKGKRSEGTGGPFRNNADPIYKITFDASAMCVKRLEAAETLSYVQSQIGRALTTSERMALVALFKAAGKTAPCLYCYVEAPRAKMATFAQKGIDITFGKAIPKNWSKSMQTLAAEAQKEAKALGLTQEEVNANAFIDPNYIAAHQDEVEALSQKAPVVSDFIRKAALAAKANLPKRYEEYISQVLDIPQHIIDELNNYAGLRFFSSSDFQAEHVADLMQAFFDMELRQIRAHGYTKVPMFIRIFGDTGMKIQTSVFAKERGGEIVADEWQGMAWDEAKAFRQKHENVGTVLVATSDAIARWGLKQDWIDYIIPFHYSGMEGRHYKELGWQDFTSTQSEKSIKKIPKGEKPNKIRMHDVGVSEGITDEEATRKYLELAKERGLYPVFPALLFKDMETVTDPKERTKQTKAARARWAKMVESGEIDWSQIDPGYFKLKKDYARTDTAFQPVKAQFNLGEAKAALDSFLEGKEPKAKVDTEIADRLVQMINEAEGTGRDIGVEMLRKVREEKTLNQPLASGPRGSITFTDSETLIKLFKGMANFSTMLHETAHLFINDMEAMVATGKASEQVVKDLESLKAYAGDLTTVEAQEKLARAFEAYLREGKAPSAELRSAFGRFRAWLTAIYRSVKAELGVELNDEVRGVFDRMLAAEDEIANAESKYANEDTIFEMLTPAEQKRIKELKGRSHEDALEKRTQRYVAAYMKALGGKKAFEAQALAEVEAMPVYKNIEAIIKEGGLPVAEFDERFGQEFRSEMALKFPGVVNLKEGSIFGAHDMDMLAVAQGYSKADEMIADFQMAKTKGEAVRELTNQKIAAEEARLREQLASEPAEEDIHNDSALEKLVLEAKALERKIAQTAEAKAALSKGINSKAMRDVARGVLDETPVSQATRYDRHSAAERRAGIEAAKAMKAGKWEEALAAKQREALNHALVLEAVKLREEIAKGLKRAIKISRSQSMDFAAKEQVLSLIETYEMGSKAMAPARPEELTTLAEYFTTAYGDDEFGLSPLQFFSPWVLNKENAGSYKALTVSQLKELNAVINALADVGGSEFARMVSEQNKTRQEKVDELVAAIMSSGYETKKYDRGTTAQRVTTAYRDVLASLQKMPDLFRNADGNVDATQRTAAKMGPNQAFAERIFRATVKMLEMLYAHKDLKQIEAQKLDFAKRFQKQFGERTAQINGVTVSPVRQAEGTFNWTAEMVWSVALNMGNEGNLRTLLQGDGLTEEQLIKLTSILTVDDWQAIQKTWDTMGAYYGETDKVFRQVYGFPMPSKVVAQPLRVITASGAPLDLPGGYFPIKVDSELNPDIGAKQEQDLLKGDPRNKFSAAVSKGHTKERQGTSRPVTLSYEVAYKALHDQAKFIALAPVIKDASGVFKNLQYRRAMVDAFGKDAFDEILPWLKNIANPTINNKDAFDSWMNKMRHLSTLYILGLNIKSASKQYLGLAGAASKLGTRWVASGLAEMAKFGGMGVDFVNEQSAFMKNRDEGLNPVLAEINARARGKEFRLFGVKTGLSQKQAIDAVMVLTRLADRHVTYSVWLGAFKRGQAEGMTHQESVEFADRMVRRTQMSGSPVDVTGWQRDEGGKRFLTMFMSEAIPKSSRMRSDFNAYKNGKMTATEYARSLFYESIAPAVGYTALMFMAGAASPKDWWKDLFWQFYNETIGTFPLLGSVSSALQYGQTEQTIPGLTGIELALKVAKNGGKLGGSSADKAKFYKALVDFLAFSHGVGNLRRVYETAAEGWKDIDHNKTANPFRLFFRKPKEK